MPPAAPVIVIAYPESGLHPGHDGEVVPGTDRSDYCLRWRFDQLRSGQKFLLVNCSHCSSLRWPRKTEADILWVLP